MNKPTDLKQGEVVPVNAPQVPATRKPPNGWKRFRTLCTLADEIVEEYAKLCDLRMRFYREPSAALPDIDDVALWDSTKSDIARCRELLAEIDRDDYYEEDEDGDEVLKRKVISERLALMIGAVHIAGPKMPEAFVKVLLAHVFDAEISYPALESACRAIEAREKFAPVTAQILEEIKTHEDQWCQRGKAIRNIETLSLKFQDEIRKAQPKFELEQAKATVEKAKREFQGHLYLLGYKEKELVAK
jgi:hypothetical protein